MNVSSIDHDEYDLVVVGGGINGVGIARDAAGRGMRVLLCEKGDLSEGTSSRSGKYIHGGLRYLEYYEFRLVREALIEREVILDVAPHLTWPMRLILPHSPEQRPRWLIRLGLFLYDHLGGRKKLPATRALNLRDCAEGSVVKTEFKKAFEYADVWVDDARLVIINAIDARRLGATVLTRTACVSAAREEESWSVTLRDETSGQEYSVRARGIINAAGPWVEKVLKGMDGVQSTRRVRLVKGSHIIMKRWWQGTHGYVLQNTDKRLIFVNPYFDDLALIGTTDIPYENKAEDVTASVEEIQYLLGILNRYFKANLSENDVLTSYSGVRPLYDDDSEKNASAVTRDYTFELDSHANALPLLSVFGGKLTTYRKLSEHALDKIQAFYPRLGQPWTRGAPLPGGTMEHGDFEKWMSSFSQEFSWLPPRLARHYGRTFGSEAYRMLEGAVSMADLGQHFGGLFYQREAQWFIDHEWAKTAEDILHRRSKHGIFLSAAETQAFNRWLEMAVEKVGIGSGE